MKKPKLPARYSSHSPRNGFGSNIAAFALAFAELQEKRHAADYDPIIGMKLSDARAAIKTAQVAIVRFKKVHTSRKRAFLSLLLFPPRR